MPEDIQTKIAAAVLFGLMLMLVLSPLVGLLFMLAWNIGLSELLSAATGWSVGNINFPEAWFAMLGIGLLRGSKTSVSTE